MQIGKCAVMRKTAVCIGLFPISRSQLFHHLRVKPVFPYTASFLFIRRIRFFLIMSVLHPGRFQNLRNIQIIRMIHDTLKRLKPNLPEPVILMPVLHRPADIFAVVHMEYGNHIPAHDAFKRPEHLLRMVNQVIAAVMDMAGVKTNL